MFVLSFVGQKGGSSKSTCAVNVASEWNARGLRTLLVDADPQQSTSTWSAVALEAGGQPPPTVVAMRETMHRPEQLPRIAPTFDRVVIDTPGRSDAIQRSALMCSDVAIVPCQPSAADVWSLAATIEIVRDAMVLRPDLRAFVLLSRVLRGTTLGRQARSMVEGAGLPLLRSEIGQRIAYVEAFAAGKGVTAYAPGDVARLEVEHLVDELEELAGDTTHAPLRAAAGA